MRKTFYLLLAILIIFAGCRSSQKLLRHGKYEEAVEVAVKKLMKNPNNERQARILRTAYPLAVNKIKSKIDFLKREGNPANWDKIYKLYLRLKQLQDKVEIVTPVKAGNVTVFFNHEDYDSKLIEAKNKAAEYHYAYAKKLMQQGDKLSYRKAYEHLIKVKQYGINYPDLEQLIKTCLDRGTSYVLIVPVNRTIYRLPEDFLYDLVNIPVERLNSKWIIYHNNEVPDLDYDLILYVVLKDARISANEQKQTQYVETKEIKVGERKIKDANGTVKTVPVKKKVSCKVNKVEQQKVAHIYAELQYVDAHTKQTLKVIPVAADHVFQNAFAVWAGDKRACSKETLALAQHQLLPFPSDIEMIIGAAETLKRVIWNAIWNNRYYVESHY